MKKICVINPNYYQSSGVTKVISRLYQGFQQFYPNDFIFSFVDCLHGSEISETPWLKNADYCVFKLMSTNPFVAIIESIRFLKWLQQEKFDVIHVHHRRLLVIINIITSFHPIRVVYTSHLVYSANFLFKLLIRNDICAISDAVVKNLENTTNSGRITFTGNPVDFPDEQPAFEINDVKDCAISIGRLVPIKGHRFIVEAFHLLKLRGIHKKLLIVGEGSGESHLRKLITEYGLEDSVTLVGYSEDVGLFINKALFAILHSSIEGLGLVVIEAAAMGRPSLITDIDGPRETIPPEAMLPNLLNFGDVDALANCLEIWFQQPQVVAEDGGKFFRYLQTKHATEYVVSRYRDEYLRD